MENPLASPYLSSGLPLLKPSHTAARLGSRGGETRDSAQLLYGTSASGCIVNAWMDMGMGLGMSIELAVSSFVFDGRAAEGSRAKGGWRLVTDAVGVLHP